MNKLTVSLVFLFYTALIFSLENGFLDKNDLLDLLEKEKNNNSNVKIKIEGDELRSVYSNIKYVYLENLIYFGERNIRDQYYSPDITENYFYIIFKGKKFKVNYKDIRTFLPERYNKIYYKNRNNELPGRIKDLVRENKRILISEYGLRKGINYFSIIHHDWYYINTENGPEQRKNTVIWISDKPFVNGKPQRDITPAYKGWTY